MTTKPAPLSRCTVERMWTVVRLRSGCWALACWTYERIEPESIKALDLAQTVAETPDDQDMIALRITIDGEASAAEALVVAGDRWARIGMAWGADAEWADVDASSMDGTAVRWLDTPEATDAITDAITAWLATDEAE